ncbi:DinB family protein [Oceanobacillus jeddahense]|uniref:DinB family protein n=1 Tax=Oceanobacillus jeddahense TaxID=1462527 RepID=A0ABY5JVM8_9BACI|nr:DinB family protein [Oceanobacillus jeddahense]UUI03835.1 DinB family protein [Oceanobacillus jeddahense]
MPHAKTVLLDQLLANANDQSWYLSFEQTIEGVTEEEATWKPNANSHSIAEITHHLIYWNKVWQKRYEQADFHAVEALKDNANTFHVPKEKSFSDLKNDLLRILLHWQKMITSEHKLDSKVEGFPVEAEWWALISNAATHNAYHIGQIVYLRKMQK